MVIIKVEAELSQLKNGPRFRCFLQSTTNINKSGTLSGVEQPSRFLSRHINRGVVVQLDSKDCYRILLVARFLCDRNILFVNSRLLPMIIENRTLTHISELNS